MAQQEALLVALLILIAWSKTAEAFDSPAVIAPVVINGTCSSKELKVKREALAAHIEDVLRNYSTVSDHCPCAGACGASRGNWTQVAHLDMSDPAESCPENWRLVRRRQLRACDMASTSRNACDSAFFHLSSGEQYSQVCGKVIAYQRGSTDAFGPYNNLDLEDAYIDGVSLTHGAAGSRQHIWSFVAANSEENYYSSTNICPCTDTESEWLHEIPSFIGHNYFCDTGGSYAVPSHPTIVTEDPLWDGEGCGPSSSCCSLHNPPWFCATLPQPTTDDIELRICSSKPSREAAVIHSVDIYIM